MSLIIATRQHCRSWTSAAFVLLLAALVIAPLAGAGAQSVGGVVLNSQSGAPVRDAQVIVEGTSRGAVTDAAGRFQIPQVGRGEWTLMVQRVGLEVTRQRVSVGSGDVENVQIHVQPAAQVISTVVVTAGGEAERKASATTTVDVLDGAELRAVRASHPAAIMNRLPGVHITELSGEGHSAAIRQPITTKAVYLYLEDGIPTRSTGFFNHNALYEVNLPQAAGIEVLKGPGTALYGSDAIGGVVNALTRAAPATPGVEGSVEAGGSGYRRLMLTGGGWFSGSGFRADVNITDSDGWKDRAPYNRKSGTLRWDAGLPGNITVKTVLTGSTIDQFDVPALTTAQFEERPQLNKAPIAYRRVDALRLSSAFERESGNSLWSVTPYARYNTMELLPSWQLTFDPQTWDTRNTSLGVVARHRRDFEHWKARIVVGVDAESSPGSFVAYGITPVRSQADNRIFTSYTTNELQYDYDVTYRVLSPYVHTELSPLSNVRVDVGARYDASEYDYVTNLDPINTGTHRRPEDTRVTYSRLSPKLGVSIDLGPEVVLYGSYREGFRTPSQSQVFQQNSAANTVDLKPVKVRSHEIGVRGSIASRFAYSLSAYDMAARDDILTFQTPTNTREAVNAGRTRHRGVEAGAGAALATTLRMDVSYSIAKHKYIHWVPRESDNPGTRVDYSGNEMEQAPRELANALLTWSPPFLKGGRIVAEWSMLGRYQLDAANTAATSGYAIVGLQANYHVLPSVELFARGINLADRDYAELRSFDPFAGGEQITPGTPRTLFVGLRYGWQR